MKSKTDPVADAVAALASVEQALEAARQRVGVLNREVKDGATVIIEKSPYITRFLRRRPPTYFYQIINAKLKSVGDESTGH